MKRHLVTILALVCVASASLAAEKKSEEKLEAKPEVRKGSLTYRDLNDEERRIYDRGEITDGPYIAGGVIGTLFGFGIGHAIQSRYSDKGWIYTVGEGGSIAVMAAGLTHCATGSKLFDRNGCGAGVYVMGALAFVGFRIWEIIDVWAAPPELNHRYRRLREEVADSKRSTFHILPGTLETPWGARLVIAGF